MSENKTIICKKLNKIEKLIKDETILSSQLINEILSIDEKCGDVLFLKYVLFPLEKSKYEINYKVEKYSDEEFENFNIIYSCFLNNEENISNINHILYNEKLIFYKKSKDETKEEIMNLFLVTVYINFIRYFRCRLSFYINHSTSSPQTCFNKINIALSSIEQCLVFFEKAININFIKDFPEGLNRFKKTILEEISEKDYNAYGKYNAWKKQEQQEFEKALNIRLTAFCSNIGLAENVNISLNYIEANPEKFLGQFRECLSESPFTTIICSPFIIIDELFKMGLKSLQKKYQSHNLMQQTLSGNKSFVLEAPKTQLLVAPISKRTENPVLIKDLENIETAKKELSKLFLSQEKFDIFIQVNCSMYLDPYLTYMEKHPELSEEEINKFHKLFCKIKLILDNKIEELQNKNDEISQIELNVIDEQIDKLLKEKNIVFTDKAT